jgi:hypothetical protein
MNPDKYRLKVFLVSACYVGTVIGDLMQKLIDSSELPADAEFVGSSTEVVKGALAVKFRSQEFQIVESFHAIPMVDLRSKEVS